MENFVNMIAESKILKSLEKLSDKLSASPAFSSLSGGMTGTMGLLMIGAVLQVILAIGTSFFGLQTTSVFYIKVNDVYTLTMGAIGMFTSFNMAYTYATKLKLNGVQSGFISMVCYILTCSPIQVATAADGVTTFNALNLGNLGGTGLFVAIVISLTSVKLTRFAFDHNWVIRMPDVVPEGILNSFNAIIPGLLNILIWHGLTSVLSILTGGQLTLATLIIYVLSIPLNALLSPVGVIIMIVLGQIFWFFGIHGTGVIYSVLLTPMIVAYTTNAQLAAAGAPLVFSYIFLMSGNGGLGGSGNTLPLVLMGLKSKSKTISAVSKAALPAGLFNINEPAIFGYPIMYNPILFIPFVLAPCVCAILYWVAYATGLIGLPQVLILTTLPVFMQQFMMTLDWRNVVFALLLLPVCWIIYLPFFKVYERQMIEQEAAEENA